MKKKIVFFAIILIVFVVITIVSISCISTSSAKQFEIVNKNSKTNANILSCIDEYQEKYFKIVKRHNMFLQLEDDPTLTKDRKELRDLYEEVKQQITNKHYLQKYNDIKKRYTTNNAATMLDMNEFYKNNYTEIDNLLNEVYKEIKLKISPEDFKKLTSSEKKWIKEVEDYNEVFNSQGFGSIGGVIYYSYQIDMRNFRSLLLMLYL